MSQLHNAHLNDVQIERYGQQRDSEVSVNSTIQDFLRNASTSLKSLSKTSIFINCQTFQTRVPKLPKHQSVISILNLFGLFASGNMNRTKRLIDLPIVENEPPLWLQTQAEHCKQWRPIICAGWVRNHWFDFQHKN